MRILNVLSPIMSFVYKLILYHTVYQDSRFLLYLVSCPYHSQLNDKIHQRNSIVNMSLTCSHYLLQSLIDFFRKVRQSRHSCCWTVQNSNRSTFLPMLAYFVRFFHSGFSITPTPSITTDGSWPRNPLILLKPNFRPLVPLGNLTYFKHVSTLVTLTINDWFTSPSYLIVNLPVSILNYHQTRSHWGSKRDGPQSQTSTNRPFINEYIVRTFTQWPLLKYHRNIYHPTTTTFTILDQH